MMMTNDADEKMLNSTFAQARADDATPSQALMDRIMQDADDSLAASRAIASRPTRGFLAQLLDAIGGWPAASGLVAATVAGVWIGAAQPSSLMELSADVWGTTIQVPLLESDLFAGLEG